MEWHWDWIAFGFGCFGAFIPYIVAIIRNAGKFDIYNPQLFAAAFIVFVPSAGVFTAAIVRPPDPFSAFYTGISFPVVISSLFGKEAP